MIEACLFDMDGVIVDTARFHFLAWQRLAHALSIPFTEEDNEHLKGVSRVDSLQRILQKGQVELDEKSKQEWMDRKNQWYLEYVSTITPKDMLPGVANFLHELREARIKIGLGSSSKNAMLILEKLGITELFDTVIDGIQVQQSKPHPEVFLAGARQLHLEPSDIVVFEDAISGVKAAVDGGFRCVGIGSPEVLTQANWVIPSFENFNLQILRSWTS